MQQAFNSFKMLLQITRRMSQENHNLDQWSFILAHSSTTSLLLIRSSAFKYATTAISESKKLSSYQLQAVSHNSSSNHCLALQCKDFTFLCFQVNDKEPKKELAKKVC